MHTTSREVFAGSAWSWAVVLLGLLFVVARIPLLLVEPHFFAEENVHFAHAFEHGPWRALLFVHVEAGYFNLAPNVGAALAKLLPLERAPFAPVYLALLLHLAPFIVLAFGRGVFHVSRLRRALVFCVLLFLPTLGIGSWANTINAQTYLGVAVLLLLLDEGGGGAVKRWWQRCLLVFAGLSGVYAAVLQPVFWWRARSSGRREHRIQFQLLTLPLLTQLALAFLTSYFGYQNEARAEPLSAKILSDISTLHIGWALFGKEAAPIAGVFGPARGYVFLVILLVFVTLRLRHLRRQRDEALGLLALLLGAYLIWTVVVVVASFQHRPIGRYAIPTSMALVLFLIANIRFDRYRLQSGALLALLLFSFSRGLKKFRPDLPCAALHGDTWNEEVRRFESGDTAPLRVCPGGWHLDLRSTDEPR